MITVFRSKRSERTSGKELTIHFETFEKISIHSNIDLTCLEVEYFLKYQ